MATLRTDYTNGTLNESANTNRVYRLTNSDGTVFYEGKIEDVSSYTEEPSTYGASDINSTNAQVNTHSEEMVELKNSVSNGKKIVADAITTAGIETSETATFDVMSTNIGKIVPSKATLQNNGYLTLFNPSGEEMSFHETFSNSYNVGYAAGKATGHNSWVAVVRAQVHCNQTWWGASWDAYAYDDITIRCTKGSVSISHTGGNAFIDGDSGLSGYYPDITGNITGLQLVSFQWTD